MDKTKYKIILPEAVEFYLEDEVVQMIPYLKNHFNGCTDNYVNINNIRGQIFSHIVTHIRSINIDPTNGDFTNRMLENVLPDDFLDIVIAADFLGINSLVEMARERFIATISCGDVERIRKTFKLKYDLDKDDKNNDVCYEWKEL